MIRTRKTGSVTMLSYLSSSFIYTKVTNMILWFYADLRMGLLYTVLFVCKYSSNNKTKFLKGYLLNILKIIIIYLKWSEYFSPSRLIRVHKM